MVLVTMAAMAGIIGWVVFESTPSRVVRKKQAAFLQGVERRSGSRVSRLVAEDYGDRWKFSRNDLVETLLDGGHQFIALVVKGEESGFDQSGKTVTIEMKLVLSGKPLGIFGNEITRRINSLKEPFTFTWEKKSFLPSSWRLIKIDNPGLPVHLYGYKPGLLQRMKENF